MADYDSSLPVRTEADGDVVSRIVDTNGTNQLVVDGDGRAGVKVGNGSYDLAVNTDGSINVNQISVTVGTEVHEYDTSAGVAPATPTTVVSYTVTTGKTLLLKGVQGASSGKAKVELKTGTPASETAKAVGFVSTASGEVQWHFDQPIEVIGDDNVIVVITNTDKQNTDLYGWINGVEI